MNKSTDITREDKIHRTALLLTNEVKLRKIKIFPIQQVEYNSKELPQEAIYRPYQDYIFCTSTIREKQRILYKFSTALIKLNGILYFPLFLPSRELRSQLIALLDEAEIKKTDRLTITYKSKIQARTTGKKKNIPNNWMKKLPLLEEALNTKISYTAYQPPKNMAKFPLYITEKNVNRFIRYATTCKTPYGFYFKALIYHVALSTGLFGQYSITKVVANITDIKKLLPCNFSLQKLCRENKAVKIEKVKNQLIFNFKMNALNTLHHHVTTDGKTVKHQRIMLPFRLINHALRSEAFGRNGLPYLLLIVFGYRCQHPKVNYKPSTIVSLCNINVKRGVLYTIEAINKPLRYLKNLQMLDFEEVTKESYKADTPIKIELYVFKNVKF